MGRVNYWGSTEGGGGAKNEVDVPNLDEVFGGIGQVAFHDF